VAGALCGTLDGVGRGGMARVGFGVCFFTGAEGSEFGATVFFNGVSLPAVDGFAAAAGFTAGESAAVAAGAVPEMPVLMLAMGPAGFVLATS
jgi:hypothetical protein